MIRGELTGALYVDTRASDKFPRKSSQSAGHSGQDDVQTLCPPDKTGAPSGSSLSKEQSLGVSRRQHRSPPHRVVSRSTPPRSFGEYKRSRCSGSRSPRISSSQHRRQRSHRRRARQQRSETFDCRSRGRSDAGRSRCEPSAYDRPPGPHGVDRRRQSPLVYGRRHYPSPPGHSALNRQHTEFRSPQSGLRRLSEGALSQVAVEQCKLKKQAKDKERKLQKMLHTIDIATEEKIRKVDKGEHCVTSQSSSPRRLRPLSLPA